MRRKSIKIIGQGNDCPKCHQPMERRAHDLPPKDKTWFYIKWDVCRKCRHIQHYEEFKSNEWQEQEQQDLFFSSLR